MIDRLPLAFVIAVVLTTAAVACKDDGPSAPPIDTVDPPEITRLELSPVTEVEPGGTLTVRYSVESPTPLRRLFFFRSGAFAAVDSFGARGSRSISDSVMFPIPASGIDFSKPLSLTMEAADTAGRVGRRTATTSVTIGDRTSPTLNAVLQDAHGWGSYTLTATLSPQDSLILQVSASDNYELRWIGWRLGPPANAGDSVAVGGPSSGSITFAAPVRAEWTGNSSLTVFARDALGNVTERVGAITVYPLVNQGIRSVALKGPIRQFLYDEKRQLLYMTRPDMPNVAVLSMATLTLSPGISLPSDAGGMDLTATGDSLLVALPQQGALAVIDLTTKAIAVVPRAFDTAQARRVADVRVAANGKALVFLGSNFLAGGRMMEYELASGAQRPRPDAGVAGALGHTVPFVATRDRLKVALHSYPDCAQLYDARSDTFSTCRGGLRSYGTIMSVDASGTFFTSAHQLLDGTLGLVREIYVPRFYNIVSVLSPDGDAVYFPTGYAYAEGHGVAKARTSDGATLEQYLLPIVPELIHILPDGATIVANGRRCITLGPGHFSCSAPDDVYVVDLR